MKRSTAYFLAISSILSLSLCARTVLAENMESGSYKIQFGNFNITSGEKSSASYNVTDTVGQTGAGPYGQYGVSGYFVGSGFQYIYQIDNFSFRLSKIIIDLGTLTANVHNTDSHTISITTRGGSGYQVYVYESHPLRHTDGITTIPDTTCNSGTCSYTTAGVWTTQTVPGFGFNVSGNDVASDFVNSTYFRSFANAAANQPMQSIMSSSNIANNRTATVTYKVGVTGSQAEGVYMTNINYVAVPGY